MFNEYLIKSEVYVDENYKQPTAVVENNNNPVWSETFTINLGENRKHKLNLNVLDKDNIGSDEIRDCKFDYEEAFDGIPIGTRVKLSAKMGLSNHGEVHTYVQFTSSA